MRASLSLTALALALGACGSPPAQPAHPPAHDHGPPAPARAHAHDAPRAQSVEVPASAGAGPAREVKSVYEAPGLKVVTIVLRQGTSLPTHHAEAAVTIQALAGSGVVVAGGARLPLDRAHFVALAPGEPHAVEPEAGADLVLLVHHAGGGGHHHP